MLVPPHAGGLFEPQALFLRNGKNHTYFLEWWGNPMTVLGKSLAQYVHIVGVSTGVFIRVELCFPERDYRVAVGQAPRTQSSLSPTTGEVCGMEPC